MKPTWSLSFHLLRPFNFCGNSGIRRTIEAALLLIANAASADESPGRLPAQSATVTPPYTADFESPAYTIGSINGQHGWSVQQGTAVIAAGVGRKESQGLKLAAADPFSQAKLTLAPGEAPGPVMFLDFYVLPAASDAQKAEEFLDIDGARIGLFLDSAKPGEAVLNVFHGDGSGGGTWMATSARLKLKENTAAAREWVRLTLREDFLRQSWDLSVDGKPAAADLGFQEANVGHTQNYIIMGDAVEAITLDDLVIQSTNPMGPDSDGDGIVDSVERQLGMNPFFDDRDGDVNGNGHRNLEEALMFIAGEQTPVVNQSPVLPPVPLFSIPSGFLDTGTQVAIAGAPPGGSIHFTKDGTDPRAAGTAFVYQQPIAVNTTTVLRACAVDAKGRTSEPATSAWVFADDVAFQSRPEGAPAQFHDFPLNGGTEVDFPVPWQLTTGSDPGLIAPEKIPAALKAAPVVVLAAGPAALFDSTNGVYSRSSRKIVAPSSLVYMAPGKPPVSVEAAVSISGESSRYHDVSPKHSLRLRFSAPQSAADLITGGTGTTPLRQAVLRHPTHDSWTVGSHWINNRRNAKYFADGFASRWMNDAGHMALKRQWVHVFLDASYWGVYEAIEQNEPDPAGITDLLEGGPGQQVVAIFGDSHPWRDIRRTLNELGSAAFNGQSNDEAWRTAVVDLDLGSLTDYILINWWMTNLDWPEHNYLIARSGGKWRFLSWDAEWAMRQDDGVSVDLSQRLQGAGDGPGFVFASLCWWPEYRGRVAARMRELTADGGLLHPAILASRLSGAAGTFQKILPTEAARWGAGVPEPGAVVSWEKNLAWLNETYLPQRSGIVETQLNALLTQFAERAAAGALAARDRSAASQVPVLAPFRPADVRPDYGGDRDGDGIPDEWETGHGLNPRDGSDGLLDSDGDGLNNLAEYLLGRDPGRAEPVTGAYAVEPSGVGTRAQIPKIRNGQRVSVTGRVLSAAEAEEAAREEAKNAGPEQR
jgi:hypothetical protein